jgi:predicted transcriptional regulator
MSGTTHDVRADRTGSSARTADEGVSELGVGIDPTLDEVVTAVLDLRGHERASYHALLDRPGRTTGELAAVVGRDRSNVNRSLTALVEKGLVTRHRRVLEVGGHVYQYTAKPPDAVRLLLHAALEEWARAAHDRVDEFLTRADEGN